jgi:hypothetical protein
VVFLVEVVGLVLVAVVVREFIGGSSRPPLYVGLTVAAVVVGGIAFWGGIWGSAKAMMDTHDAKARLTQGEADTAGGGSVSADTGFLTWVGGHVPRDARLYLECGQPSSCRNGQNEWITYQLVRHVFVPTPQAADYVVFNYVDPRSFPYARGWRIQMYGPKAGIGERPK